METGLVTKNKLRYANIKQIHDHFVVGFCMALPAFHVSQTMIILPHSTRSVTLAQATQATVIEKDEWAQQVFSKLNEWFAITEEDIEVVDGFVCVTYEEEETPICK